MLDVDIHLRWHEGGPNQATLAGNLVRGKWHARAWAVERGDAFFGSAVWEHYVEGKEHAVELAGLALFLPVNKLGRKIAGVVHNQVGS